jgi:hypothetical protein
MFKIANRDQKNQELSKGWPDSRKLLSAGFCLVSRKMMASLLLPEWRHIAGMSERPAGLQCIQLVTLDPQFHFQYIA